MPIIKKSINCLSNTKECMHIIRMGNVCIYSEGLIVKLYQKTLFKDRRSYIIDAVIRNEKTYLSVPCGYGLIESYFYFRVTVLVKSHVYRFIELQLL